ncbi:MAG: efflux RND transporter periplasmic adaptor subunit [Candidatus Hydrogenedentes bacterium]|nr:efflux RND transporter periplasmic adaptor subunit [Candidatus Hydrogenedentota bacterium]
MYRILFFGRRVLCLFLLIPALSWFHAGCSVSGTAIHDEDDHVHAESEDAHGHEHDSEEAQVSVTLWTESLELFTEFPLLQAGTPQRFLLHLTHVNTGLPLSEGEVSYRAEPAGGGAGIEGTGRMERPGIFIIEPAFPAGGEWHLQLTTSAGTVTLEDLDVHGAEEVHDHAQGHEEDEHTNEIVFTKEQQWVVPVITAEVVADALVERHPLQAIVLITPESKSTVAAPVGGILDAPPSGIFPKIGDTVDTKHTLAKVTPTAMSGESLAHESNRQNLQAVRAELAAQAAQAAGDAAGARARAAQLTSALDRAERLYDVKAGAKRDVEEARSALAEARAAVTAAEERAALARQALRELSGEDTSETVTGTIMITAPIAGRITAIYLGAGAHVEAGQTVFEVVNTEKVIIEAQAPEVLAPEFAQPPSGMFELPGTPGELHPIVPIEGGPAPWMLPYVDAEKRTIPLQFPARNPDGLLRLGMTLTLWADTRGSAQALKIPRSAVLDENGVSTVYVMLDGECFQKRPVRTGMSDGAWIEVLDGMKAGERVVSGGVYAVRLAGTASGGLGSAHVH